MRARIHRYWRRLALCHPFGQREVIHELSSHWPADAYTVLPHAAVPRYSPGAGERALPEIWPLVGSQILP